MRVVVAGAGPGGLATAVGCARRGHDVTVLERAAHSRASGTGVVVMPNGVLALDRVGVGPRIRAEAVDRHVAGFRDRSGRPLLVTRSPTGSRGGDVDWPWVVVSRGWLQEVLIDELPAGSVRWETPVRSVRGTGHDVRVVLDDEVLAADVVVAADGIHSTLRRQHFPAHPGPVPTGRYALRGLVARPPGLDLDPIANTLLVDRRTGTQFGCFPLRDDSVYWFTYSALGTLPDSSAQARADAVEQLADWHPVSRDLVAASAPSEIHVDTTASLTTGLPSLVRGRTAFIGDAAHAMTPDLGQGANQAFEDAAALAGVLDGATAATADQRLAEYDARRRPRVRRMVAESARMGRTLAVRGPVALARDLLMSAVPERMVAVAIVRSMRVGLPEQAVRR